MANGRPSRPAPPLELPESSSSPDAYFGGGSFDSMDDMDDDERVNLSLDVDPADPTVPFSSHVVASEGAARRRGSSGSHAPPGFRHSSSAPPGAAAEPWPTGTTPDSASLKIDSPDLVRLARYGVAPASLAAAPGYALRVYKRKRELQAQVKTLAAHLAEAEAARDALLVSMVQDLRGRILMAERGEQLFQPVVDAEREALERRAALAGTNAEYDRRAKDLDSQNADLRRAAEQQQGLVQQRRGEAEARRQVYERAEARRKRLYIELRPLAEATERGAQLTAAQENRIGELEYEIERQKPECENATRALQLAMAAVETAETEEEQFWKRVRAVEAERQALDQEFKKEIGASSAGVEAAEKKRSAALADVGREVLAARGRVVDVSAEGRRALLKADAVVIERSLELEKGLRAIDVYDRDGYRNGVLFVSAVAIGLVAIVLIVLAAR